MSHMIYYYYYYYYYYFWVFQKEKRKLQACFNWVLYLLASKCCFYFKFLAFSRKPNDEFLVNVQEDGVESNINGEDGAEGKINRED